MDLTGRGSNDRSLLCGKPASQQQRRESGQRVREKEREVYRASVSRERKRTSELEAARVVGIERRRGREKVRPENFHPHAFKRVFLLLPLSFNRSSTTERCLCPAAAHMHTRLADCEDAEGEERQADD